MQEFIKLYQEAMDTKLEGWDFSFLKDRVSTATLPWNYKNTVLSYLKTAHYLLDMGTGGGELLSTLHPLPLYTYATEGYKPNVLLAKKRLEPLGINIYQITDNELPFDENFFDLIINHHAAFSIKEIYRVLKLKGYFITQQVGKENNLELNKFFLDNSYHKKMWDLSYVLNQLKGLPVKIHTAQEAKPKKEFYDVGAIVFYLKNIRWQIKGFQVENNLVRLQELHGIICREGSFETHTHRFFLIMQKL